MATVWNGWRLCKRVLTSLLVIYLVLLAAVQISQRITRRRAEHLLSDLRGLRLERSSWSDAQAMMQRWGRWGAYEGTCDANHCVYDIRFDSAGMVPRAILTSELASYLISRSVDMASPLLGAHLPNAGGGFEVQNNLVVGTWFVLSMNPPEGSLFSGMFGKRTRDLEPYDLAGERSASGLPHSFKDGNDWHLLYAIHRGNDARRC